MIRCISVIGLGYVGLPVATTFAWTGMPVVSFDIDARRIAELSKGQDRTGEVEPDRLIAKSLHCEFRPETVDHLIQEHYEPTGRPMRRCQPRDLMHQIRNYCVYNGLPVEMRSDYFDRVVPSYFTVVAGS